jgi:Tfp pilus assembly protein PilN
MGQFNLNLSTRPFKPYRAANLGLMILLLGIVAISALQVYTYQQNSTLAGSIRPKQQMLKAESEQLTQAMQLLNGTLFNSNAESKMSQVQLLNEMIERKKFSWTRVFGTLEQILPENCYLMNMRPFLDDKGRMGLNITFRSKSFADGTEFVRVLENSDLFSDTAVGLEELRSQGGEVDFALSTYYVGSPEKRAE